MDNKFLFFDTETTGRSRDSYLVQVAWFLTYDDGEVISQNEFIVKPDGYEIPYGASAIHGITTSMARKEGEDLDIVLEEFTEDADKAAYIVGHNISFDLAIMQTAYKNASMEFPLEGKTKFDTMTSSTQWCKLPKANGAGYKWPKLEELYYKLFGENFDNAHSASADTEATMKCFFELVDKGVIKGVIHDSPRAANRHPKQSEKAPLHANKDLQKLILVDGSAFLFRSYFSTLSQSLSNDKGFPTGAMFGVINAIKHLQRQYQSAKLIMIFDSKGSNFRHQIYPQYKANRKPADESLIVQIEPLYQIIRAMGFHFICEEGVEADDVIATLAKLANAKNIETIIASSDKDLLQLVGGHIKQLNMKGTLYDAEMVKEKMGVRPYQILDLLALTGDASDNIPGVPMLGPKTASKWLQLYGSVEGVKANAESIGGKVGESLRESFDLLDLSYKLVQLKFDVELPFNIFEKEPGENTEELRKLFQEYGFSMWLKQLGSQINKKQINPKNNNKEEKEQKRIESEKVLKKIDLYKKSCELGNARHCAELGHIYWKEDNLEESMKYYEKACAHGDGKSCVHVGGKYQNKIRDLQWQKDINTNQNKARAKEFQNKANEFFAMACNLNYGEGCSYLGRAYEDGKGDIKQDHSKATEYFEKACDLGCSWGCVLLGNIYKEGKLLKQNYSKAMEYYEKSCEFHKGTQLESICFDVAEMYKEGKNIKQDYSKAIEYYEKGCDLGDAACCLELGRIYGDEESPEKNDYKAFNTYKKGCQLYDTRWAGRRSRAAFCCNNLGIMYAQGKGTSQDIFKSIACFEKACDLDYSPGLYEKNRLDYSPGFYNLAQIYEGFGDNLNDKVYDFVDYDGLISTRVDVKDEHIKKALKFYKKACELGNSKACDCYKSLTIIKNS